METKEIKIVPPEGYEVDKENSTFDCIKFKPVNHVPSYDDICRELFSGKTVYWFSSSGTAESDDIGPEERLCDRNNCTSREQALKVLALNKMMNVAKYLNGPEWRPDFHGDEWIYVIRFVHYESDGKPKVEIDIDQEKCSNGCAVYFKTRELAKQAVEILGEETIQRALSTDW